MAKAKARELELERLDSKNLARAIENQRCAVQETPYRVISLDSQ